MEIYSLEDGITHVEYLMHFPKKDDSFLVVPEIVVNFGRLHDCNVPYCKEHGIKNTYLPREGGCFVFNKGDVILLHCDKECNQFYWGWTKFLKEKLSKNGIEVNQDDNDLMIGQQKFCGSTVVDTRDPDYDIYICCISVETNNELIDNICLKPATKEPCGLASYGISTETVLNWYREFLWQYM